MKKISKVATASVLLFTLANPLGVLAENNVENISATSNNKLTQDITIQAKEVNGGIVFEVTAAKDTYNTVIHATINGQKFTYNLGNLKKGQVSKVVQPDVSVNRKDVNTNKKDAAISKENRTEKSLPNTSVVRELVEKTVSYNTELNGNVIEANLVYKTYELVEKKDEKAIEKEVMPEVAKPVTPAPKAEEPATPAPKEEKPATPAPKVEEPVTPAPKVEAPTKPSEPEEAGEGVKPTPKEDASEGKVSEGATPGATTEEGTSGATGETSGTTSEDEGKEAKETEEAGEGVKPTPKEDGSEGKVSEGVTPGATTEEGTSGATGETSGTTAGDEGKEAKETEESETNAVPKENATEAGTSEATGTEVKPAPNEAGTTPGAEVKETEESETNATPKENTTEGTTGTEVKPDPKEAKETEESETNPTPKEDASEGKVSEGVTPGATTEEGTSGATSEDEGKEAKAKKELADAQKEGEDIINERVSSKLGEIEKVKDETEKEKLKVELKTLKEDALAAIKNAKNHDAAVEATDEYQAKIDGINVPGEELPAPNYSKDNLSNGRNDGTTIEGGSTAIGHGSGEAPSATTQPAPAEGTDNSSATTSPTQPATGTNSDSTVTDQPQPAATAGTSSFRRAGEYQARARRVARAANQPDGTVNISYNYDGMPDINGFLSDPRENNTVAIPNSATEEKAKELVKEKIQAKVKELAKYGYTVKEEIIFEQDTNVKNFNYVVTFTKEKTGTTGFRIAPEVQVRAKKVVKRDLSNKEKQINIYYNLTALKDIAGALGNVRENNLLTLPGNATKEEIKKAIEEKTKSQIEQLNKQGFKVTSTTDLDRIVEGSDNYDYVVEFTKETKAQSVGNTGFRKAPATQRRVKRSTETQETVDVNIYFNLKTLPGIAGALDVDGDTTIKLPKDATVEQVKAAIQTKIAKVEKRGYKVSDFYFGAKTERGYDFVVEFKK